MLGLTAAPIPADPELVGARPYEMAWARRTEPKRAPLVDFEAGPAWTVETRDAEAVFSRSRERQLWGRHVGKLAYRGTGPQPLVTIRPPAPVPIDAPFDCVNVWAYGNNSPWFPFPDTPPVRIAALFRGRDGTPVRVDLARVHWYEWWLVHVKLSERVRQTLTSGAAFTGFEIAGGSNREDRVLYFDDLAVYTEALPPLTFEPRPRRGLDPFPGQSPALNTGPGRLPFPNREETILPDNLTTDFRTSVTRNGDTFRFRYQGADGVLDYDYTPRTGTLRDVRATWQTTAPFRPLDGNTIQIAGASDEAEQELPWVLADLRLDGNTVLTLWRLARAEGPVELRYALRLWQKSLVVDVACTGGAVERVRLGAATGVTNPRLVSVPYLSFRSRRPAVLVTGPPSQPLFVTAYLDWYRSNASELFAANSVDGTTAVYNGGSLYRPKTDGRRNDCFERLFLTVSPRFEEVLPNIPNPESPWLETMADRLWTVQAATADRDLDYARWAECARYGITNVILCDHEPGWRDGGESFTLRTRAAPGKGGDKGQAAFAQRLHKLGFRYGLYNNYTDFAPVNEHWDEDRVTRLPDGEWRRAWSRCYNLKPARAVELENRLAPVIQEKFRLRTGYCDVHSIVTPWEYCDYDARVPGAGTFAATYYAYGEIMLNQKRHWNGPVYSEGGMHWMYAGLTDGNYAQDPWAGLPNSAWLVDFDLRKIHPLSANFGMGKPKMFNGRIAGTPEQQFARLDEFLAATIAFGHTGYLNYGPDVDNAIRTYFRIQQLAASYARARVRDIRYADADGQLLDTSAAVAADAVRQRRILTRYDNGLCTAVNGNRTDSWQVELAGSEFDLPPFGYAAVLAGSEPETPKLFAVSGNVNGRRADYVESDAYFFADARGVFTTFRRLACDGMLIAHRLENDMLELIPAAGSRAFAVNLDGRSGRAVALDSDGRRLGKAETRLSRGWLTIVPHADAFKYRLIPGSAPAQPLRCDRTEVVPGEWVTVTEGRRKRRIRIPISAAPGTRHWQQSGRQWLDFRVVPVAEIDMNVDGNRLQVTARNRAPDVTRLELKLNRAGMEIELAAGETRTLTFGHDSAGQAQETNLFVTMRSGAASGQLTRGLRADMQFRVPVPMPENWEAGHRLRGDKGGRTGTGTAGAEIAYREMSCAAVAKRALYMHPPWRGAVGSVSALFEPSTLPKTAATAFRALVGKGDGSDPGDGVVYRVVVVTEDKTETVVAERTVTRHEWHPFEADLSTWAGRTIRLKLVADVGSADNSEGDWGCWADMRLESADRELVWKLADPAPNDRR